MSTRVLFMYRAYAGTQDSGVRFSPGRTGLGSAQGLPNAVGDGLHLDLGAGDSAQELVRGRPLPLGPELLQERAGFAGREPLRAEARAQVVPQLRLERPRAQVRVDVEARIDVGQVVRGAGLDLGRVSEELDVAPRHRRD